MKTIPPICPEPEVGRKYWRSLDQLAGTQEFRQWMEREFPQGASELTDPLSRRHFVQIMSASFLLAGFGLAGSGCRRPEEKLEPFGKAPENYIHGVPQYYATAMPTRCGAIPLVAKATDGRPIKVEGNAQHPDSNGGTDRFAQASILNLYDPDRSRRFLRDGNNTTTEAATDFLNSLSKKFSSNQGEGLAFLVEPGTSPTRLRLQKQIAAKMPKASWFSYDPIGSDIHQRAASQAFGQSVKPYFKYDAAKVIVSLDCDFIGAEEDAHNNIRRFAQGRKIEQPTDSMNRLYVVESLMSLTGINADHRLRTQSSMIFQIAAALAGEAGVNAGNVEKPANVDAKWIAECAKDLVAHKGESLVVAGVGQPLAVHLLAWAINSALGNIGKTVLLHAAPEINDAGFGQLAKNLDAGTVDTLVILGGNPAYNAPAQLNWAALQRKAKTIVRLGYYEDETSEKCAWHLPMAHYLESWGDARTSDGTLVPIQPLIAPLFGGLTEIEVLARIAGANTTSPYELVRETFAGIVGGGSVEEAWKKFLHDGFQASTASAPVNVSLNSAAAAFAASPRQGNLEVVFRRDYKVDDGRYNNNGWLQELPDPITKLTWDNAVLISRKTAKELGVKNKDVVRVIVNDRSVEGPIWVQPGQADNVLGLTLGYGRTKSGRVGAGTGFNAYAIRAEETGLNFATAKVEKTGKTYPLACTQDHWAMEGRPVVREANLDQFRKTPGFAKQMKLEEPAGAKELYPNPFDELKKTGLHQWGMSVDLNACVGCGTCTLACQSENNIPIVGKDLVSRGREMQWLRIDRYYTGDPAKEKHSDTFALDQDEQFQEWIDDPQVVTQPLMCQHCESAPCESVCPVNATVHDQEGLNLMVYNRCVGTRYCSNNCPYKVRRFNYLDLNKRSLKELKGPFYASPLTHSTDGKWDLLRWWKNPQDPADGMRPDDEWDLIKMSKNPDVTVRMRGVMEKCTFCVQRIEQAKIAQKVKAGASGDVIVPEGTFTTACAQACPAGAIVFGNIADPESRVSKLKKQERDYTLLDFLLTKPRLTYLAKLRNPNPAMPDYRESPLSLEEYMKKSGSPFEHHEEAQSAEHAGKGAQ